MPNNPLMSKESEENTAKKMKSEELQRKAWWPKHKKRKVV